MEQGLRLTTGCVTRLIRRVPLVEQDLLTLPEHQGSLPVFSGVRVTRSLVVYVCFVDRCLSFCTFSFGHCVVCSYTDSDCPCSIFKLFLESDREHVETITNCIKHVKTSAGRKIIYVLLTSVLAMILICIKQRYNNYILLQILFCFRAP